MELGLRGKAALVTGATRGIGLAIARALAAEGALVAVVARTRADVERVARELDGVPAAADLTTEEGCLQALTAARERIGPVSILVNNLGLRAGTGWGDTGAAEFEEAMAGNLVPAVRLSQLALPEMLDSGWGRVVVVASVYGREAGGAPAYNAAKAAEISFVKSLAREVSGAGVTVNSVAPGSVLFEGGSWHRRLLDDPEGISQFVARELPLGRFGRPEEVASVVAFLCSTRAAYVSGACWVVDGAQSRTNL